MKLQFSSNKNSKLTAHACVCAWCQPQNGILSHHIECPPIQNIHGTYWIKFILGTAYTHTHTCTCSAYLIWHCWRNVWGMAAHKNEMSWYNLMILPSMVTRKTNRSKKCLRKCVCEKKRLLPITKYRNVITITVVLHGKKMEKEKQKKKRRGRERAWERKEWQDNVATTDFCVSCHSLGWKGRNV